MSESGDNDKTRLAIPGAPVSGMDDKTRIAPSITPSVARDMAAAAGLAGQDIDKTLIARTAPIAPADADKTQFTPSDRTRIASRGPLAQDKPDSQTAADESGKHATQMASRLKAESLVAALSHSSSQQYPILKKRFVFEELLGIGGMGAVYKAKDLLKVEAQDRDPYVAIKVLNDEFKTHPEAFIALQRESRKSQRIAHPNIVNVYDFDRDGETVFMTMEYMDGKPLDKLISQYRGIGLPSEQVFKILEGICAALVYAHAQNIIHSDFKPGNIFVNNLGFAKVFDFGIARAVAKVDHREESQDDRTVFDAGKLGALTPAYASLEMLEGLSPATKDDIYALGCIAYELFAGVHPFAGVHADVAKRRKLKPKRILGLPKHQWKAIEKALAFDRINRTVSVELFWREFTRKNTHSGKIVALLLVMMVAGGGAYYQFKPKPQKVLSEAEVRSQIEKKLRFELQMKALADLLTAAKLTSAVEAQLWAQVQELRRLVGKEDAWLMQQEAGIYQRYLKEIGTALSEQDFELAKTLTANAYRYGIQTEQLKEFEALIAKGLEEKKRLELARQEQQALLQQQQKLIASERPVAIAPAPATREAESVAERNNLFQVGLSSVNSQLACQSNIDMKDFDIAITKLKSLNAAFYQKEEPRITSLLAKCIEHIGSAFPERAIAAKSVAMRIFNSHPTIAAIVIAQKDPCGVALAGLGSRGIGSSCKDKLNGASRAPAMVVIPASGSLPVFAIGKYEVSVDELNEYCQQSRACEANATDEGSLPATRVPLSVANGYSKWLSEKSNRKYRLPSLAEWQYATKAKGGRVDQNRNCKLNSRGIQKGNSLIKVSIGQQNEWGLVNYIGNAREWVMDSGGGVAAVGGSFETPMEECDIANKAAHSGAPDNITGFRVLREVKE